MDGHLLKHGIGTALESRECAAIAPFAERRRAGEELVAGLLLLAGRFTIEEEARLDGSVFLLGGELIVLGEIAGDLSMLEGKAELGSQARVAGDLIHAGGSLERSPGSEVLGTNPQSQLEAADFFATNTTSAPSVADIALRAIIQALLASAALRWLPTPVSRVTKAITRHAVACGAVGVFTGLIALILMVQMAFSVVLVSMSVLLGFLGLISVSLTGVFYGHAIGRALFQRLTSKLSAPTAAGLGAAAFSLLGAGLQFIPYVGTAVQLLLMVTGLGALILTHLGLRSFNPEASRQLI